MTWICYFPCRLWNSYELPLRALQNVMFSVRGILETRHSTTQQIQKYIGLHLLLLCSKGNMTCIYIIDQWELGHDDLRLRAFQIFPFTDRHDADSVSNTAQQIHRHLGLDIFPLWIKKILLLFVVDGPALQMGPLTGLFTLCWQHSSTS